MKEDNPELVAAREKKIPTMERALLLGGIMRHFKKSVAVAGTHGKTTTTGLLAAIFLEAQTDPTISIGGELESIGGNIRAGESDVFITEACEYHRSFLNFFPFVSVILNVDADHLDYFKDIEDITDTFYQFAQITPPGGAVVVNCDNENAMRAAKGAKCSVITVSAQGRGMLNAQNITYNQFGQPSYDVVYKNEFLCRAELSVAGSHNVLNSLCAFACAHFMGISPEIICAGLKNFKGVRRRFENKGMAGQTLVMDDYAHHPTEIAATIDTLLALPHNEIYVVFQPHTYTRTKALLGDFVSALSKNVHVIVTDIYAAREKDTGMVHARDLAEKIPGAVYKKDFAEICGYLKQNTAAGDIVMTMGAGNVYQVGEMLLGEK